MRILVTGGTGTIGSRVVRQLIERGEKPLVLVRNEEKARSLPAGAEAALGDLEDGEALGRAMEGVERLFLLAPVSQNETELALAAFETAREAGARRIVYLSVFRADEGRHIPHFGSKLPVEEAVRQSGLEHLILRPNEFFHNDLWFLDTMRQHGLYPNPLGRRGVSRVSGDDVAAAAVGGLTAPGEPRQTVPIVGPQAFTGPELAAIYGRLLGRDVQYFGDDLEAWEQQASQRMPDWMVEDLRVMYAYFQAEGMIASDDDLAATREALGREPERFEDFARGAVAG